MEKRINWIDWAKTICMFLVILGHTHVDNSGLFVKKIIYTFHMPLFFFLSGLLCKKIISKESVTKDCKLILVPYIFYGTISIFIPYPIAPQIILSYLHKMTIGSDSSIGAIWFLPALFICKQIGTVIICISHRHTKLLFSLVIISFIPTYYVKYVDFPFFLSSALCGLPYYLIGFIFMKYLYIFHYLNNRILLLLSTILSIVTILLSYTHGFVALAGHSYGDNIYLYYINAITGILAVTCICMQIGNKHTRFTYVSAYGNIATIWSHGVILSFLHYYLFRIINISITDYSIYTAIVFSTITSICSFYIIIFLDKKCPTPFGLRGAL